MATVPAVAVAFLVPIRNKRILAEMEDLAMKWAQFKVMLYP